MESINALLEYVYESIDNYESYKEAQGESYNIFQVLDISNMEVIMCRMLADMINPEGMHGCGDRFLRTFVRKVLNLSVGDDFFQSAKVIKEYLIPRSETGRKNRRIDIVIRAKDWFIPIEVKIRADDQRAQCYDYYHFAAKQMDPGKARVYYLTKLPCLALLGPAINETF